MAEIMSDEDQPPEGRKPPTEANVSPRKPTARIGGHDVFQHARLHYDYRDYLCGFGAAIVNIYITFPINKVIFRQMLHGHSVRSATADLRAEGIRHLYRGVGPPLIQRSISLSLMFGTFGTYHYILDTYAQSVISAHSARFCLAAFLAGSTEALLCPFELIQMLLQVSEF